MRSIGLGFKAAWKKPPNACKSKDTLSSQSAVPIPHTNANNSHTAQNAQREHLASVCNPKTHRFWEEANKTSALNFTPDSTLFPLQVYIPPSYVHGSHHCWLLFNLRGEEVMEGGQKTILGSLSS